MLMIVTIFIIGDLIALGVKADENKQANPLENYDNSTLSTTNSHHEIPLYKYIPPGGRKLLSKMTSNEPQPVAQV